jgi:putative spermidine/putrescine transport system permease protein
MRSIFKSVVGAVLMIWLILPLLPIATWSISRSWYFPQIVPDQWSLRAWEFAISQQSGVPAGLFNSTIIAIATTAISLALGIPAARALGLAQFRGKRFVELLLLAPIIVPGIAVVLGIHTVFIRLGLTNTMAGVVLVHLIPTLPYVIFVMSGVFSNFNPDFEQQARSLGASRWQVFRNITLPAILPGIAAAGLFAFLVSWSQYILTLVIGGGRVITMPLLLFNFASAGRNDLTGAIAIIYILPGMLILALTAHYLAGRSSALSGFVRA